VNIPILTAGKTAGAYTMKKYTRCMTAMSALLLIFGLMTAGCPTGGGDGGDNYTFVAVTGITGVPTAAIMGNGLTLRGTVAPANATNKTIVWSGTGVSNGVLTAESAGIYTVTATIRNGASTSGSFSRTFDITVYDAGSGGGANPFGNDTTPVIWGMHNSGGVYATVKNTTWESEDPHGEPQSGTYSRIGGKAAQWTVTGGGNTGDTGLAIIQANGEMLVANLTDEYSDMNGTFTKLNTGLTFTGTWITTEPVDGDYARIVADGGNWTESLSPDLSTWKDQVKGTYPTSGTTNPVVLTITEVDKSWVDGGSSADWANWDTLSDYYKHEFGGSQTHTVVIYDDRCEAYGMILYKVVQP
jgi:hypothetical protein